MDWRKLGRITSDRASYPAVDLIDGSIRLYFARRVDLGPSRVHFMAVDRDDPLQAGEVNEKPLFELGAPGTFDCDGHAVRWVVETDRGDRLMYLYGWNQSRTAPFHVSIGCARSVDGKVWTKFDGPVMDRSVDEPFFCTTPCVFYENGLYRMWYSGGIGWHDHEGKLEPLYRIHHAESVDGLHWRRTPCVCIDTFTGGDAIAYPMVWRESPGYRMLFCHRGRAGYRDNPAFGYRMGYATSTDGLTWDLRNDEVGIERSAEGWDSVMMAYPALSGDLLFYNGNGFGATGIGVARRIVSADT